MHAAWRLIRRWLRPDHGQAAPLLAMTMTAFFGMGALTVDVGYIWHEHQNVQNAVDAGALAGAQALPDNAIEAESKALEFVLANAPDLTLADVHISFRCLVGDRNNDGVPDPADIPVACNPGGNAVWFVTGGLAVSNCIPSEGDKCNVLVVTAGMDVDFFMAPVMGILNGNTGNLNAAACRGLCGGSPNTPIDLVVVIDRTGSMSSTDITNARNATRALLQTYDPNLQWLALGFLGPSRTSGATCGGANSPARGLAASAAQYATGSWVPVGFTGIGAPNNEAYRNADGTVNNNSLIAKAINCFDTSGTGTNLSTPVTAARDYLLANGRPGVRKGILIETDGSPNFSGAGPSSAYTCSAAAAAAANAKNDGIEIVTVGFGVTTADTCPDASGAYKNVSVVHLLADMATDSVYNSCTDTENLDGDHFFCLPKSTQLNGIFQTAAVALGGSPRLITLPQ
jgi:hypothetical protein